jgi:SSS family solute:Na+ symporter
LVFLSFLLGDMLIPPVFQRLVMGRSVEIARKAYMWSGLLFIPICLLVLSHGLIALALNPELPTSEITAFLFKTTLPLPIAIIALLGFMAVIMSSADSYLNAAAGALVNDVVLPIAGTSLSDKISLRFAKWTTVILGVLSITFAIAVQDILDILLKTYQFWGPTMVVPLLGILIHKQLPPWGFYVSVFTGGLVVVTWNTFDLEGSTHLSALIAGIGSNALAYLLVYFIANVYRMKKVVVN